MFFVPISAIWMIFWISCLYGLYFTICIQSSNSARCWILIYVISWVVEQWKTCSDCGFLELTNKQPATCLRPFKTSHNWLVQGQYLGNLRFHHLRFQFCFKNLRFRAFKTSAEMLSPASLVISTTASELVVLSFLSWRLVIPSTFRGRLLVVLELWACRLNATLSRSLRSLWPPAAQFVKGTSLSVEFQVTLKCTVVIAMPATATYGSGIDCTNT